MLYITLIQVIEKGFYSGAKIMLIEISQKISYLK